MRWFPSFLRFAPGTSVFHQCILCILDHYLISILYWHSHNFCIDSVSPRRRVLSLCSIVFTSFCFRFLVFRVPFVFSIVFVPGFISSQNLNLLKKNVKILFHLTFDAYYHRIRHRAVGGISTKEKMYRYFIVTGKATFKIRKPEQDDA